MNSMLGETNRAGAVTLGSPQVKTKPKLCGSLIVLLAVVQWIEQDTPKV